MITMIYKNYAHLTLPAAYRERIAERAENTRRFVVPLVQVTLDDVIGDRFTLHLEGKLSRTHLTNDLSEDHPSLLSLCS